VEFVTKVTNDICVKYFWTPGKFLRLKKNTLSVKFADFRQEFSQINRSMFVFEYIIAQKTVSLFKIDLPFLIFGQKCHDLRVFHG